FHIGAVQFPATGRLARDAGVVDQDVERPEFLRDVSQGAGNVRFRSDIAYQRQALDCISQVTSILSGTVKDGHTRARRGQTATDGRANSLSAAGYQRGLAVESKKGLADCHRTCSVVPAIAPILLVFMRRESVT